MAFSELEWVLTACVCECVCVCVCVCVSLNTLLIVVIRHILESSSPKSAITKYTHFPALTLAVTTGAARSSCGYVKSPNALRCSRSHDTIVAIAKIQHLIMNVHIPQCTLSILNDEMVKLVRK